MKKTLAAATIAALVGVAGAANAADLYKGGSLKDVPVYVPPPLWTGFYIGGHMGIAWSRLDLNDHVMTACDATGLLCNRFPFGKGNLDSTNGFGGGQFGYNFQGGNFLGPNFVYGIEVDLGAVAMNQHNNRFVSTPMGGAVVPIGMALDGHDDGGFYGDVTGRLGYAWGSALIYAKGGFAFLDVGNRMRETMFFSDGTSTSSTATTTMTILSPAGPWAAAWSGRSARAGRSKRNTCTSTSAIITTIAATTA